MTAVKISPIGGTIAPGTHFLMGAKVFCDQLARGEDGSTTLVLILAQQFNLQGTIDSVLKTMKTEVVKIYQGERPTIEDQVKLGGVIVKCIAKKTKFPDELVKGWYRSWSHDENPPVVDIPDIDFPTYHDRFNQFGLYKNLKAALCQNGVSVYQTGLVRNPFYCAYFPYAGGSNYKVAICGLRYAQANPQHLSKFPGLKTAVANGLRNLELIEKKYPHPQYCTIGGKTDDAVGALSSCKFLNILGWHYLEKTEGVPGKIVQARRSADSFALTNVGLFVELTEDNAESTANNSNIAAYAMIKEKSIYGDSEDPSVYGSTEEFESSAGGTKVYAPNPVAIPNDAIVPVAPSSGGKGSKRQASPVPDSQEPAASKGSRVEKVQ